MHVKDPFEILPLFVVISELQVKWQNKRRNPEHFKKLNRWNYLTSSGGTTKYNWYFFYFRVPYFGSKSTQQIIGK